MGTLSKAEIEQIAEAIAPLLVENVRKKHHEFWIDPEEHYNDHKSWAEFKREIDGEGLYDLKNIVRMYRVTKSLWFKAFLGFAAVGAVLAVIVGLGFSKA